MVPPSFFPKRSTTRTSPGCNMSSAYWLLKFRMPAACVLAVTTASRSERAGMNCTVNERPTIFFPGCRTSQSPTNWLYPPPPPPRPPGTVISSWERPLALSIRASGTFGRPSGNRSPVHALVYSTIWSLVQVHNCALAGVGASTDAKNAAAARDVKPYLRIIIFETPLDSLTPQIVVRPDVVPLVRRLEPALTRNHVLLAGRFVQRNAETRPVGQGDVTLVDDRFVDAVHQVAPERHIHGMVFQRQEVLRRGGDVHARQGADRGVGAVQGHGNAVFLSHVSDLLGFEDSAGGQDIGMDDIHRMVLAEHLEGLFQEDVLAREDRDIHGIGDLL